MSHSLVTPVVQATTPRKVYIIGDSTVMTYRSNFYPEAGWGQILPLFFNSANIQFDNRAIGGRSSRSFINEGRWATVVNLLRPGDFVFIQFGHNDRNRSSPERFTDVEAFRQFMRIYVLDTRAKGAFPVLVTPMIMHAYNGTTLRNVFAEGGSDYRGAMVQVATELNVPLIDLNIKSHTLIRSLGRDYSASYIFLGLQPGEYPNFPNGSTDGTHFQEMGAFEMAKLIVQGINELRQNPSISLLIPSLLPSYQVSTISSNPSAGLMTRTNTYPAGFNVTLKVTPHSGFTFQRWTGATNNMVTTARRFSFVMGPAARSYNAVYAGSSAARNYQAETATIGGGAVVESTNGGFNSSGYINFSPTGGFLEFRNVDAGANGSSTLRIRYALGVTTTRTGRIVVNGAPQSITFDPTGGWTTWAEKVVVVGLNSGASNTVRLESTGQDLANIDELRVP